MGTNLENIVNYLDQIFKSKATDGLIIKRGNYIEKVAFALDLNENILRKTEENNIDLLIVFNSKVKSRFLKKVNCSTYISEIPLKTSEFMHAEQSLADKLGITVEGSLDETSIYGTCELNDLNSFKERLYNLTGEKPRIKKKNKKIGKIAIGGKLNDKEWMEKAKKVGVETILTTENPIIFKHKTHMNIIYRSKKILEITSILKLGELLEKKYKVEFLFID